MDEKQKEVYLRALDQSLHELLGKTATKIVYNYLEEECKIKKEEFLFRREEVQYQLQKILGYSAKIIEEKIDKNIKSLQNKR